ncbi:MAG: murein hydrolase activator EnvC [Fimbriimonadaceae bacterium]
MKRIAVLLVVLLVAPYIGVAQTSSKKSPTAALKQKLDKIKTSAKGVRSELRDKKEEVWVVAAQMEALDAKLSQAEAKLDDTRDLLDKEKGRQKSLADAIEKTTKQVEEQRRIVALRIRAMYMTGDDQPMAVLLGSRDFSDFAVRQSLLERIAKHDRRAFDEFRRLKAKLTADKAHQDKVVANVAQLELEQAKAKKEVATARSAKLGLLNKLRRQRTSLERELQAMEDSSDRITAQILAYQQGLTGGGGQFSGRFVSPVNGRQTSGYGYRVHPISRTRRMHTGVDIAAPTGTPIRAAATGVVISAGWMNGYGNTVVIDHGGGISTLYGHCSRLYVSRGQKVQAGQRVAAVGSTGFSTGPHLHFEKRVNGRPVNPRG